MTHIDVAKGDGTITVMGQLIDQYINWLTDRGSPRTVEARRDILGRIDRDLPYGLDKASTDEIRTWVFRDELSLATRETYYGAVRAFFTWACNPYDPKLDFDPTDPQLLPRPKTVRGLPRPVTDQQLGYILRYAVEPFRTWALLAAYEGLRCIEISGLRREHVDERSLRVVRGKGGRPGILPTHPQVWAAIRVMPDGPVAWTPEGTPASEKYVSIRSALHFRRQLGMPGVGLHRLRHWYGTEIYRQTRDIRRTQELLRHASPATTAIYTLITDEERTAAIRALPTFDDPY